MTKVQQKTIPVFYSPKQVADEFNGISPSAYKPREVVASWQALGIPLDIHVPTPVTEKELSYAHDLSYVRSVLTCRAANGFGSRSQAVASSLPWTSGSLLSAARHALKFGGVAISPTSGFHHACYSNGGGFCTFNGLAVTAATLKREGLIKRVGILDCDYHYGNGTDEIIRRIGAQDYITHLTSGKAYELVSHKFLEKLPELVRSLADCDLILYQAGADPHNQDPLGGFLSSESLRKRDEIVFKEAREWGIPIVWNLAGGYQEPLRKVLNIHDATLIECAKAYLSSTSETGSTGEPLFLENGNN